MPWENLKAVRMEAGMGGAAMARHSKAWFCLPYSSDSKEEGGSQRLYQDLGTLTPVKAGEGGGGSPWVKGRRGVGQK